MLQKAIMPFGVEGGTRSRAAERMMTYNTGNAISSNVVAEREWIPLTIIDKSKQKEGCAQFEEQSTCILRLREHVYSLSQKFRHSLLP